MLNVQNLLWMQCFSVLVKVWSVSIHLHLLIFSLLRAERLSSLWCPCVHSGDPSPLLHTSIFLSTYIPSFHSSSHFFISHISIILSTSISSSCSSSHFSSFFIDLSINLYLFISSSNFLLVVPADEQSDWAIYLVTMVFVDRSIFYVRN